MKNRAKLTAGAVIIVTMMVLSILLIWQRNANTRLRQELNQLREETTRSGRLTDDNERLQKENQRLVSSHLRMSQESVRRIGEIGRLNELLKTRNMLGNIAGQSEDAQRQLNESLQRAAHLGETNVITAVEAAALQHLSVTTKTELLRKTLQTLMDVAQTNDAGLQLEANQLTPEQEARWKALESGFDFDVVYKGPLNQLQDPRRNILIR